MNRIVSGTYLLIYSYTYNVVISLLSIISNGYILNVGTS